MLTSDGENRVYWLDNLRSFMVFLVVLLHAAIVYEKNAIGALWWIVFDPSDSNLPSIVFAILDIFVVATLFFVAGYCTPLSLKKRQGWAFLLAKFRRLIIPWALAVLTLIPAYKVIYLYSRNLPQQSWENYFHWNSLWSQNWLWFLPVLFLFNVLYLCLSNTRINLSGLKLKTALGAVFLGSIAYGCCIHLFNLRAWTTSVLFDFQNDRLLIYFLVFLLGALCWQRQVFADIRSNKKLSLMLHSTGWLPIALHISLFAYPILNPGKYLISKVMDTLMLQLAFVTSLAYLLYAIIMTFRIYLNKQGPISKIMNRNAYSVYIVHTVVLGMIALPMLDLVMPSLLKLSLSAVLTFVISNLIASAYRGLSGVNCLDRVKGSFMRPVTAAALFAILLITTGCTKRENADQANEAPRVSLHVAVLLGNLDAIGQHINAGSDLDQKDAYGSSPLHVAITFDKTDISRALIDAGADLTVTNNEGATPLHIAAFFCRTEIVDALLAKGADRTLKNNAGHTALETVAGPFADVEGIYDTIGKALKPLGLKLDYDRIKETRPQIAEMLRQTELRHAAQ